MELVAQEAHFAALQLGLAQRQLPVAAKADTAGARRYSAAKQRYTAGEIGTDAFYLAQTAKDLALQVHLQALRGLWVGHFVLRRATMFDFATGERIR